MAGRATTVVKRLIYQSLYKGISFSIPTPTEIGLSLTVPNADGTNFTEPDAAAGYMRVTRTAADWTDPDLNGEGSNSTAITFPVATGLWGDILYAGFFEAAFSSTDPICFYELNPSMHIDVGEIAEFSIGNLSIDWVFS